MTRIICWFQLAEGDVLGGLIRPAFRVMAACDMSLRVADGSCGRFVPCTRAGAGSPPAAGMAGAAAAARPALSPVLPGEPRLPCADGP